MERSRHSQAHRLFLEGNLTPDRYLGGRLAPSLALRRQRFPVVNGIFYPDNSEALIDRLTAWGLREEREISSPGGQIIIAPHGAWDISGMIAAAAFAKVQAGRTENETQSGGIKRIILLGPCHGSGEQGIYLSESASFQTPLGDLPVDRRVNQKLASCSTLFRENDSLHLSEHSLEILLPMAKYCFPGVKIVPILAQGHRPVLISGLARALRLILEEYMDRSLLVVSSNAAASGDPSLAFSMADEFRTILASMDTGAFLAGLSQGRISACGGAIIAALLDSGLLGGRRFSALTPLIHKTEENGHTVYYSAFAAV